MTADVAQPPGHHSTSQIDTTILSTRRDQRPSPVDVASFFRLNGVDFRDANRQPSIPSQAGMGRERDSFATWFSRSTDCNTSEENSCRSWKGQGRGIPLLGPVSKYVHDGAYSTLMFFESLFTVAAKTIQVKIPKDSDDESLPSVSS